MKKMITILTIAAVLVFNACLLTDEAGVYPTGSISGDRVAKMVEQAANSGILSGYQQVKSNSRYNNVVHYFDIFPEYLQISIWGKATVVTAGVKTDRFYTAGSVAACTEQVFLVSLIAYKTLYENYLDKRAASGFNPSFNEQAALNVLTTDLAGAACKLEETGKVLHLTDQISL